MDGRVPGAHTQEPIWIGSVSPSLSNVAEVYSPAMLHYSGMAGPWNVWLLCLLSSDPRPSSHRSHLPYPPSPPHLPPSHSFSGSELQRCLPLAPLAEGTQPRLGGQLRIDWRFAASAPETLTKLLPTTSCAAPSLAGIKRCLCQSRTPPTAPPRCLSMTSGWHHWRGIKVIKSSLVHYCKGQRYIKTHRWAHAESKLRCFSHSWMWGQLSTAGIPKTNIGKKKKSFPCQSVTQSKQAAVLQVTVWRRIRVRGRGDQW